MKSKINALLIILIFVGIFSVSCDKIKKQEVQASGDIVVYTSDVNLKPIARTINYPGLLKPLEEARLGSQLTGKVSEIKVKEGELVKKGQLLLSLSEENLTQAKAQFNAVDAEWKRMEALFKSNTITPSQYDQAKAQYEATKAAYELALDNTKLYSPFAGEILDIAGKEDEIYSPMMPGPSGEVYLIYIVNDNVLKMEINITDKQIMMVEEGQEVIFTTDANDGEYSGYVYSVTKTADPRTGTFPAVLHLPNSDINLPSGIYSTAHIVVEKNDSALVVPQNSIISDSKIFIVKNNKSKEIPIKVGIQTELEAEILVNGQSGAIKSGDTVVTSGNIGLMDNQPVKIISHNGK